MEIKQYIIVDDLTEDAHYLKQQLDGFPFLEFIGYAHTVEQALYILSSQKLDLVFLDLVLNGKNSLNFLQMLSTIPPLIITSAYPEYAAQSYDIGKAADYLLKPYSYERLLKALSRALSIDVARNSIIGVDYVFLKMGRQIQRFDLKSIDYIEAYGIYSKIYTQGQIHIVNERLLTLTHILSDRTFMRIHKSFIVNIGKVTRFDRNFIWIGTLQIPVGNSFRPRVDGLYKLFSSFEEGDS